MTIFSYVKCLVNSGKFSSIDEIMISKANHEGLHSTIDYLLIYELLQIVQKEMDVIVNSSYSYQSFLHECISKIFDKKASQINLDFEYSKKKLSDFLNNPETDTIKLSYVYGPKVMEYVARNYFDTSKLFTELDEKDIERFLKFLFEKAIEFRDKSKAKDDFLKQVEFLLYLTE